MARNKLHISLILGFTALFVVFNIGLPVVLHYCEMMNTYSTSNCDMCHPETKQDGQAQYAKLQHSCCTSVVLANYNKVEFLQAQNKEIKKLPHYSITPLIHTFESNNFIYTTLILFSETHSPPAVTDIPILYSSLLI